MKQSTMRTYNPKSCCKLIMYMFIVLIYYNKFHLFKNRGLMSKNVVLVGGSSGIGRRVCEKLLEVDCSVTVLSRSRKDLPSNINHFEVDILQENPMFPELSKNIDAFVYLPGSINLKPFRQLHIDDFKRDINVNYFGLVKAVQKYLKQIEQHQGASIVFMSSVAATVGMKYHTSVAASKAAIEGFMRSLAAELAPKVRVNAIAPSLVKSDLSKHLLDTSDRVEHACKRHPLERVGDVKDIAEVILFLISENSSWITGQVFHVDGGISKVKLL